MRKLNRTDEIVSYIRAAIESGAMPQGSRLEERRLSEQFGVSKTPVREALIQLSSRGLVELRQRRGATVTVMKAEQVVSMFEVMTELEGMAAMLAADRMTSDARKALVEIHQRSERFVTAADPSEYHLANQELHEAIYQGSCNEYLESNIKDMRACLNHYRRYPFQKPGRILQSFNDHAKIVGAIVAGDGALARTAMDDHLTTGGRIFANLVAQMPQLRDAAVPTGSNRKIT